jgi:hypothetical protein
MLMICTSQKPTAAFCQTFIFVSLLFLILALLAPLAVAQDESLTFDPHPLRPAEMSSPRDTLRSFISNTNEAIQAWRAGESRGAVRHPAQRVIETFDFSQLQVGTFPQPLMDKAEKRGRTVISMKNDWKTIFALDD